MSKKTLILMLSGLAITGAALLMLKKLFCLGSGDFHLYPVSASSVDVLQAKNFGEFPVEIPEDQFEGWGM